MERIAADLVSKLNHAFPRRIPQGIVAPHECLAFRQSLAGKTWSEVPNSVVQAFSGSLPLLSPDAYNAYLPVWLRTAIQDPGGDVAAMVIINLSSDPSQESFTPAQARIIIAVVEFVASNNGWGLDDPSNAEHIAAVKSIWGARPIRRD